MTDDDIKKFTDLTIQTRTVYGLGKRIVTSYHLRDMKNCLVDVDRLEDALKELDNIFQTVKEHVLDNKNPTE